MHIEIGQTSSFFSILGAIFMIWLIVAAVFDCQKSKRSDLAKINWITFIICVPFIGAISFLVFGSESKNGKNLSEKEAELKQRFNRLSDPKDSEI